MIAVVIAIAIVTFVGFVIVRAIDPTVSIGGSTGAGFIVGCGVLSLVMMALSALGVRWTLFTILPVLTLVFFAANRVRRSRMSLPSVDAYGTFAAVAVDGLSAICVAGYGFFATLAPPWEWDFWAIWGLKARVFFVGRGIDTGFLTNPDVYYSHPDYPPLLPLVYDFMAVVKGEWDDRWLGLTFVACAAALLLVMRDELRRATGSGIFAAVATLVLSGAACTPWIGLADGLVVAAGTAGLLVLERGARDDDAGAVTLAGCLLGVCAMTKNEGLVLAGAALLALFVYRRQRIVAFVVPTTIFCAPWLLWRVVSGLGTDVVSGGVIGRAVERLSEPVSFFATLAGGTPDRGGFWLVLALLLVIGRRWLLDRHGVIVIAVVIQTACYLGIYAGTMHDLAWHVQTSMGRISGHLAVAVGATCALAIWDLFLREEPTPAVIMNEGEKDDVDD